MQTNHPLLDTLRALNREIASLFPRDYDSGLGGIGLFLTEKLTNGGYYCTPKNSCSFAYTGGEGVHFSFLGRSKEINEASPIIVTIPAAFDHNNFIVGEDLFDFLCFGIHRGFFALEQLGYNFEETFTAYTDPRWQPSKEQHYWVGFGVDAYRKSILDLLIERLGLVPWQEPRVKFDRLQEQYLGKLQIPADIDFTEIHIRRRPEALVRSVADLCEYLSERLHVLIGFEELPDGQWIILDSCRTKISIITLDETGNPSTVTAQVGFAADPDFAELLAQAFEKAGWELYKPEADE